MDRTNNESKLYDGNHKDTVSTEEFSYRPTNHLKYLLDEHYHHSEKGCEVKLVKLVDKYYNVYVNKICLTHNKTCSKSGWELGWYGGKNITWKDSRGENDTIIKCQICGKEILAHKSTKKYCKECQKARTSKLDKEKKAIKESIENKRLDEMRSRMEIWRKRV